MEDERRFKASIFDGGEEGYGGGGSFGDVTILVVEVGMWKFFLAPRESPRGRKKTVYI